MMAFVTMTAAGRFYSFCIAVKTGTNVVTARSIQCEFWRRWALNRVNARRVDAGQRQREVNDPVRLHL
jgi:hypothetical protein